MHRFFLPPSQTQGAFLELHDQEAQHAAKVLRLRPGNRAVVLNGAGQELFCEVREVQKRSLKLKVIQRNNSPPPPFQVALIQAVTKAKAMDLTIQKAAELGAHRIVPVLSARSVAPDDQEQMADKADKWRTTAIEAVKQCGSPWLPVIDAPVSVHSFLARNERFDLPLVACLQNGAKHPREHFRNYHQETGRLPRRLAVWIGPEGDYTPAEMSAILGAGALPITLGELILRSETAAIYALSVLNYELQDPQHARSGQPA